MRILITGQTYAPARNGQAVFTTNLAEGLAHQGHQVVMIAPANNLKWKSTWQKGVRVEAISSASLAFINPNASASLPGIVDLAVEKIARDFQPDVIHIQDHYMIGFAALNVARRHKIRIIGTNHFMPENVAHYVPLPQSIKGTAKWLLWQWMLDTYNQLDLVTGPSRTAVKIMCQNGLYTPAQAVSCGVDLARFRPISHNDQIAQRKRYQLDPAKKIFLFVGRVDEEKRIDLLLRAFNQLQRTDIQLAVIGRGASLPDLQNLAEHLNLNEQVRFLGYLPDEDLPALLNSVDVFVMPSEAELLSIASLEAMACGRPLLLARAQALPELVSEGVNGYLFDPGSLDSLTHYIAILADQPEALPGMGAASIKKVAIHSLQNTVHAYEKLYEFVLANPKTIQPRFRHPSLRQVLFKR